MDMTESQVTAKAEEIQLLTFKLDEQEYALNIANVVQVVRMVAVTKTPQAPHYVEGVVNLRGKVIPVVDIRKRYNLPGKPCDLNTQLLIARTDRRLMALIVDVVSKVLTLPSGQLEPPAHIGPEMDNLAAVGKLGDRLLLILDPATLLPEGQLDRISG
jgi:purine-binding chemotaxis protein CheW